MTDPITTALVLLLLGAAVILLVSGAFGVVPRVSRLTTKSFWCPFRARNVSVEFAEDEWDERPFQVSSCTAFASPTAVTCEKLCLHVDRLQPTKEEQPA